MHWYISPAVKGEKNQAMLATDCVQKSGMDRTGPIQHGVRDFTKNYKYSFSQPDLPKGIKCSQMPPPSAPHSQNVEFFGEASVYGGF